MQEYKREDIEREIEKRINEFNAGKKPTILLMGQTGAGKTSAALEYIFNDPKAKVGSGAKPCTQGIEPFPGENINVYDSEGYELDRQEHYRKLIIDGFLKDPSKQGSDGIQAVWYFISGAGKRITDYDKSLITDVRKMGYYVALVISKIDEMSEDDLRDLKVAARQGMGSDVPIFQISTHPEIVSNEELTDWNKLAKWTHDILPEVFRDKYTLALKNGLEAKKEMVSKWIWAATLSAGGVGATPIPFSDGPVLIGLQGVLIFKILRAYNIPVAEGTITSMLAALGVSNAGRWLCGQLLKLLPVLGPAANATVAATITFSIGKTIDSLCQKQAEQMLKGEPVTIDVGKILSSTTFIDTVIKNMDVYKDEVINNIKQRK